MSLRASVSDTKQSICLIGPTASGKTNLAMQLTQELPCEIISVDSAMVYRGMDIGTAKPTKAELTKAPHRLIDICDPSEAYSVGQFLKDVEREIKDIQQNNKIPLLVGGTMLYFNALKNGLADMPSASKETRDDILKTAKEKGWGFCHAELAKVDPGSAQKIHPNDAQRIQRALELFYTTGKTRSQWWADNPSTSFAKDIKWIVISPIERSIVHDRIERRFDTMLADGFLDEVNTLYSRGDLHPELPAIKTVGYRQAWDYLAGNTNQAVMRDKAIAATRQFAKRQFTWLKRFEDTACFDSDDPNLLNLVLDALNLPRRKSRVRE